MSSNPTVGEGATLNYWSDRDAGTVVRVSPSGKTAYVRRDRATLLNGANSGEPDALKMSPGGFCAHVEGVQRYAYEPNPKGRLYKVTLRANGEWRQVGTKAGERGGTVTFGVRSEVYDYNR